MLTAVGTVCCYLDLEIDEGWTVGRCRTCRALMMRGTGEGVDAFRRRMRRHVLDHRMAALPAVERRATP